MKSKRTARAAWTRREAMIKSAAAVFAATGVCPPGFVFAAAAPAQTPGEEIGPYYSDTARNRADLRANSAAATASPGAVTSGFKLLLGINVAKLGGGTVAPVSGARVDTWMAAYTGHYSAFAAEGTAGQDFLRGYLLTDKHGSANFTVLFPGWYSGRTPHIHCRVRLLSGTTTTYDFITQLFLDETVTAQVYAAAPYGTRPGPDTVHARDRVYTGASSGNGGTVAAEVGQYTTLRLAKNASQANASFNVVL